MSDTETIETKTIKPAADTTRTRADTRPSPPLRRETEGRGEPDLRGRAHRRPRLRLRFLLIGLGVIVLIVGALWYWLSGGRYVQTSDAYVQADVLDVSTDVSGIVSAIPVHEGQHVTANQVLFRLDPSKFQIAVDNARANLAQIGLNLNSLKADYIAAQRQVAAQAAAVQADQATYDRYAILVKQNAIPQQQYDNAKYKLAGDQAALGAASAQMNAALAKLGGNADMPVSEMPAYKQAAAQLAEAQREADHAVVRAPFNGLVTQVSKLQLGQFLQAGTAAFGLVSSDDMWIEAQPKETNLTHARAGDPATVTIDAYPGHSWKGIVQSIAPATDQEFSVLPAQNSSGNWVKVVQRLPVRVKIVQQPDDPPLSAGMSAEVSIDTHHQRHLSDLF
ncbi:MAG TPA: HlyD family secretion protein [Acetobacteraceae bacterium]|nr:HlyD family secretion protein [Acetobacteraceae bacterium]